MGPLRGQPTRWLGWPQEGPAWQVRGVPATTHGGARAGRADPRCQEQPDAGDLSRMAPSQAAADQFQALGDSNRRAIVEMLAAGPRSVQGIADGLPISRPAVSRHLRVLKGAGLVAERAEGTHRIYRLQDDGIEAVRLYLEQVWGEAAARFRLLAE